MCARELQSLLVAYYQYKAADFDVAFDTKGRHDFQSCPKGHLLAGD
jgi:hypothetical protein